MAEELRGRVRQAREAAKGQQQQGGGTVARRAAPAEGLVPREAAERVESLIGKVRKMQDAYADAMPRREEAVRLVRDAITAVRLNPKLAECRVDSMLGGLMTFAQLGLRVGVLGHGW